MVRGRLTAASWMLVVSSCAEAPDRTPVSVSSSWALSPPSDFPSPALIGSDSEIEGPEESRAWRSGDTMIHGITLRSPKGIRRWLVRISVHSYPADLAQADEPSVSVLWPTRVEGSALHDSSPVLLRVETFDEVGHSRHEAHVLVPADDFEHGFYPGCLVGVMPAWQARVEGNKIVLPYPSGADAKALERSMAVFTSLFHLANLELKPILDAVVARPPVVKVLLHGGYIHLTIVSGFIGATQPVTGFTGVPDPVYSFPFEVRAYESPALRGRIFVSDSRPPLLPAAGIVAIEAAHPDDPATTVSVRLLSATRGPRDSRPR